MVCRERTGLRVAEGRAVVAAPRWWAVALFWATALCCLAVPWNAECQAEISATAAPVLPRMAVVAVTNESAEEDFNSLLIVEGISNLLAQEFYDSGRYQPVEDKPEIISRVHELLASSAAGRLSAGSVLAADGAAVAGELGCAALVSATVKEVKKARSRSMIGPFSSAKVEVTVVVEVALREGEGPIAKAIGQGTGVTKSKGVFFQVRQDKVHFDQTSVGRAVQDALHEAVVQLLQGEKGRSS